MALKDQILSTDDRRKEPVATPEWPSVDGQLFLRTLSAVDREAIDDAYTTVDNNGKIKFNRVGADARLLVRCLVDEHGEPVFSEDDIDALGQKATNVISRLAEKARTLNSSGLDAEKVEEEGKGSAPDQSSSSTTS